MTNPPDPGDGGTRPYLLRAIYDWAVDYNFTPQVLVDAAVDGVVVPPECIQDGRVVLSIHPQSVQGLQMGNEFLLFAARFAGKHFRVRIPVAAVTAIYCRENGRGIAFQSMPAAGDHAATDGNAAVADKRPPPPPKIKPAAPHLKLVK